MRPADRFTKILGRCGIPFFRAGKRHTEADHTRAALVELADEFGQEIMKSAIDADTYGRALAEMNSQIDELSQAHLPPALEFGSADTYRFLRSQTTMPGAGPFANQFPGAPAPIGERGGPGNPFNNFEEFHANEKRESQLAQIIDELRHVWQSVEDEEPVDVVSL